MILTGLMWGLPCLAQSYGGVVHSGDVTYVQGALTEISSDANEHTTASKSVGSFSGSTYTATAPVNRFKGNTTTNTAVDVTADVVFVSGTFGTTFPAGGKTTQTLSSPNNIGTVSSPLTFGAKPTGMDGTFGGVQKVDLALLSGAGDTVTDLTFGVFQFGSSSTNLTANTGFNFGSTSNLHYSFSSSLFQLATQ